MVDKNLFLYDLAVVAIFKDEGRYLKEWLDYHLLAGVEHFYLYNNDSSDDYKEVLAPYVEKKLVTLIDFPGKAMQLIAYNDAIEKYRFECRYMAFIDIDEFIFPKTNQNISEVVDEILSGKENAASLVINWQIFGSNGLEKADYSRGVLERFTRRSHRDTTFLDGEGKRSGNTHVKTVANPRFIQYVLSPHAAFYFVEKFSVNSNGEPVYDFYNDPVLDDKIIVNHYCVKSREEFKIKYARGRAATGGKWPLEYFKSNDCNDFFDDSILKYRAARAENFSFESDNDRISRVVNSLIKMLTQPLPAENAKLETFLTCRAVAEKFQIKIGDHSAEEVALALIYRTLVESVTFAEAQMLLKALPKILTRPFPVCKEIKTFTQEKLIPRLCEMLKKGNIISGIDDWKSHFNWLYAQQLLRLIKL